MIKVGDTLPDVTLQEYSEVEGNGCSIGPNPVKVARGRRGQDHRPVRRCPAPSRPPARPSTCRASSQNADELKKAGVDEIWCVSVNDAFVMGAWARDQKTGGKVRMLADGSAEFAKATGLPWTSRRGMGMRSTRYSMLVKDGKVATLNVEAPGKFEVSDARDAAGPRL